MHIDIFYEKTEDSGTDIRDDAAIIAKELVSEEGEILIKGHSDRVVQITPDEEKLYRSLVDFNIEEYRCLIRLIRLITLIRKLEIRKLS